MMAKAKTTAYVERRFGSLLSEQGGRLSLELLLLLLLDLLQAVSQPQRQLVTWLVGAVAAGLESERRHAERVVGLLETYNTTFTRARLGQEQQQQRAVERSDLFLF